MCSISGVLNAPSTTAAIDSVALMTRAMAHRGPDQAAVLDLGPLVLGVTRLAILDRVGSNQPLSNETGTVDVVFNGEIYNYRELRSELETRGHFFHSDGDGEVIVHLYEEEGVAGFQRLSGMYAIALWDRAQQCLILARDPRGIKPLYYCRVGGSLIFASEVRAILALPTASRSITPDALETYLILGYVPGQRTIVDGIFRVLPGETLVGCDGQLERISAPLPSARAKLDRRCEAIREVRANLSRAVREQTPGDQAVGVLLSGGTDSGAVAALAAEVSGRRLQTFTAGFDQPTFDERAAARRVARSIGSDHREIVVTAAMAADVFDAVVAAFDEPRGDATSVPYWLIAREASRSTRVLLTGDGADELFGGYQTYIADRLPTHLIRGLRRLAPALDRLPSSSRRLSVEYRLRQLARARDDALSNHVAWKRAVSDTEIDRLIVGARTGGDPLEYLRETYGLASHFEAVQRLQYVDMQTQLADDLLLQADRAGMAHSVEVRVPFLDAGVVDAALNLPTRFKSGITTKPALRQAVAPLLPPGAARRKKRGFTSPSAAWLRGELREMSHDLLAPDTLSRHGLLAPRAVSDLLRSHTERRRDRSRVIWAAMTLTAWLDQSAPLPSATISRVDLHAN